MNHLKLFESFMLNKAHKDPMLNSLYKIVYDYKHNPNLGNYGQINDIVDKLTKTEEGLKIVARVQELVKARFGSTVIIYRGGEDVATDSNAGWSTDWSVALNFAAAKGEYGELIVASVKPSQILFHDEIFNNEIKGYINEDEVILADLGLAQYLGSVDVGKYESEQDEEDTYSNSGYTSNFVDDSCKRDIQKILKEKGFKKLNYKKGGVIDSTFLVI